MRFDRNSHYYGNESDNDNDNDNDDDRIIV